MEFEYEEHTADMKFVAYGSTMEEAFRNSARAVINHMTDITLVKPVIEKEITIEAKKMESLLYDFIEEVLFAKDEEEIFVSEVEIKIEETEEGFKLTGKLKGDKCINYDFHGDVKAMTYNQMEILNEEKITIKGVVDI